MSCYTSGHFAGSFRTVRKNTIQIAKDIPEAQYGFRPAEGARTVGETLAHIAAISLFHHRLNGIEKKTFVTFEDFGKYTQAGGAFEATLKTKAEIVAALEREGESFAGWLETLTDAQLAEVVGFPPPIQPPQKTRFELLLGAKEHEMHHRGQLMVAERMLGIVPHLTRERQQRQAAQTQRA